MGSSGVLTVISGFSGAGKGTIVKQLCSRYRYSLSVSATSRKPRAGEEDGREYFFKEKSEFEQMIQDNELIEWVEYVGNYYGTPKSYIREQLAAGNHVILEIEMEGALNVKKSFPDALLVFVTPPSARELKQRLTGRGTETEAVIAKRLKRASEESAYMASYDYIVINDILDDCVNQIHSIIQNEQAKVKNRRNLIDRMTEELRGFSKI